MDKMGLFRKSTPPQHGLRKCEKQTHMSTRRPGTHTFFPVLILLCLSFSSFNPSFSLRLAHINTHTYTHAWLACTNGKLWSGRTHPATFDSNWPFAVRQTEPHTHPCTHADTHSKTHTRWLICGCHISSQLVPAPDLLFFPHIVFFHQLLCISPEHGANSILPVSTLFRL